MRPNLRLQSILLPFAICVGLSHAELWSGNRHVGYCHMLSLRRLANAMYEHGKKIVLDLTTPIEIDIPELLARMPVIVVSEFDMQEIDPADVMSWEEA